MITLIVDTSLTVATVAVMKNEEVLGEFYINSKNKHSDTLMPLIENILQLLNINPKEIKHLVCGIGPGSFTGTRIAVSTVKAIAYSNNILVTPVTSLEALALNHIKSNKVIIPIIDAKRGNVFTAMFISKNGKLKRIMTNSLMEIGSIIEKAVELDKEIIFVGDCLELHKELLQKEKISLSKKKDNIIFSINMGIYAQNQLKNNTIEARDLNPLYLLKSQAERDLIIKNIEKLKIRKMELNDIEDIYNIEKNAFITPWSKKSFEEELNNKKATYLLISLENETIGFVGFWELEEEAHITNIAVKEEYKGLGVGSYLIEELINRCKDKKIQDITLEVRVKNYSAIKLYKKYGFKVEGVRKKYCRDTGEDAHIMWKRGI